DLQQGSDGRQAVRSYQDAAGRTASPETEEIGSCRPSVREAHLRLPCFLVTGARKDYVSHRYKTSCTDIYSFGRTWPSRSGSMDLTRRELFAAGAASVAAGAPDMVEFPHPGSVAEQTRHSANLPIRDYLVRE